MDALNGYNKGKQMMDKKEFEKISKMVENCNDGGYHPFGNFDETCRVLLDLFEEVERLRLDERIHVADIKRKYGMG